MATDTYYIKLGTGGKWAEESSSRGLARIEWGRVPIDLIHKRDWAAIDKIERPLSKSHGAATSDLRALQAFDKSRRREMMPVAMGSHGKRSYEKGGPCARYQ